MDLTQTPHRRFNPLTGTWVLVSPHRMARPWLGQVEPASVDAGPEYDPSCYLCPGNDRAGGTRNPDYEHTFVFDNDFAALLPDSKPADFNDSDLLVARSERGLCRVICYAPRHDLTLAGMSAGEVRRVVDVWAAQSAEIGALPWAGYVQVFENRGPAMGCSNAHPHGQVWATERAPNEVVREQSTQSAYLEAHSQTLLGDYVALEIRRGERVVFDNDAFAVVVPFWAVWPFETLLVPKMPCTALEDLDEPGRNGLADALRRLTALYDRVFDVPFPYSMGFHQRPHDGAPHPEWTLHGHFYPPLLRSASVRKFMVGYEMLGGPQRDLTPEAAAERLRQALG